MSCQHYDVIGNAKGGVGSALDVASGSLQVIEQNQPRFDDVNNPILINEAGPLAAATYNYPDANGISHLGFKSLSFEGKLQAGAADTITFSVWATNGYEWIEVTGIFTDEGGVSPVGGPIQAANNTVSFSISVDHFSYAKYLARLVVTNGASNNAHVASYAKAI
jgi:hypothetical protein